MRRIALFISVLVMLIISNSLHTFATSSIDITLDTIYATRGETVKMNIGISNNNGIIGMEADVSMPTGFTIEKFEAGESFKNNLDYNLDISPNKLLWTAPDYQSVTSNGNIITLYIKVEADIANGDYPITIDENTLEVYDDKLNPININLTNGVIKVVDELPVTTTVADTTTTMLTTTSSAETLVIGDIDNNKKIDVYDIVLIKKYLLGDIALSDTQKKVADFNSDEKVTEYDLLLMKKYIVGKAV